MAEKNNKTKLVKRTGRVSFYGVPASDGAEPTEFTRMEKFTTLSESKNPTTYERQYVDKDSSDSDVTGYGTSWSYNFDMHENNPILMDIASVHDDELTGETRNIVVVDFFDKGEATKENSFSLVASTRAKRPKRMNSWQENVSSPSSRMHPVTEPMHCSIPGRSA